jgi:hypothetical protein
MLREIGLGGSAWRAEGAPLMIVKKVLTAPWPTAVLSRLMLYTWAPLDA